ncbi:MAG: nucleotidyltransferase domain-containing protein [Thiohalocapsa sp.]|nr:nucleotidyltransferase domain-containing protein [Thiohalocapsa sp.]
MFVVRLYRSLLFMRLSQDEISAIALAGRASFPPRSTIRLFGSRLDDTRRGGDIDLLVEPPEPLAPADLVERRARFIASLYRLIGEQRIDVLIAPADVPDERPVVEAARRDGRLLVAVPP